MSTDQEWTEEQQRVDEVTSLIRGRIRKLEAEVGRVREDVVSMRKDFWDEVTMNFSESDDVGETSTSLRQQSQVLSDREQRHKQSATMLNRLNRLLQSPYFGRIDFAEMEGREEKIYLGIASLLDDNEVGFLVYDWRAPISNLYYDSMPGPASYETPSGPMEGELTLKRQFVIRDGRIRFMFDTGVTIGDELLQAVLSRSSDAQMKSIVATIQKEQNRIIRDDRSRMLIVQGAAGSGKTSAALQRVAYLLYKYRDRLSADQVVLFSPNPMFNSYVSTVLPELGEENMSQTTFQEYLERRLGREFQLEDPFEQLEYVLSASDQPAYKARMEGIRFKSSQIFQSMIESYKPLLEREGMIFKPVRFQGREVVSAEEMARKFYNFDPDIRLANRLELLREWLLKELAAFGKEEYTASWVDQQIELLSSEDYQRAYTRLRRKNKRIDETFDDFDRERSILARMVVSDRLKPLRKWIKALRFVDITRLYSELFRNRKLAERLSGGAELPSRWEEMSRLTLERIGEGELAYEDATPYLYLREITLGFRSNGGIHHVFIDEAQDYSPFQLSFLKRLFPRAKMTALGDFNQAIYAHASVLQDNGPLMGLYGPDQTELISLTRSYRSTKEIVEFTRGMVAGGEHIIPFNRSGDKPEVTEIGTRGKLHESITRDVEALLGEGYESVAVICKTAEESAAAHEALEKLLSVKPRLIKKTTPAFEKGIHIIPAYLAKGVEFDAVLIYDGSSRRYARESERKLFYTACTRAMHLLHIYSLGQTTPFVTGQSPETFIYRDLTN
ncbi:UvrD-helicase domain-containing protein [Paenibacillus sp. P96]|uniref:UvrD-helicase domain-containing protein n=1 Tax=Paenibacillus zeirhizosphaerae TaxID=2987519 RepID=A0ABT9FS95_9BACL|nr:RNA polymerase recycling motor HelD [Paenibacillus sp. P96]MDP4097613.1 UvrD-helicase domain-containing protein [Paenibacillus sp. P96]